MANKWFETVAVAQRRAKRHLPKSVYGALVTGAEAGLPPVTTWRRSMAGARSWAA